MKTKKILFILMLVLITLPFLQFYFNIIDIRELAGEVGNNNQKPQITTDNWFNNVYQDSIDEFFNKNIGFRPWFIKMINQIDYSLFNTTQAPGVVVGKEGNLFVESYIIGYLGQNFIGEEKIKNEVNKIEEISNYLNQNNITLMVVFTPGKASYYPEFIPDKYDVKNKKSSNYESYVREFKNSKIRFLDFNDYFKKQKNKTPHSIYSKVGTHWSSYAKSVFMDSLIKEIELIRNIDLPEFDWTEITLSDSLEKVDWDIEEMMNLIWPIQHEKMPYPRYKYNETNKTKPNVLAVGDSYWWCLVADDIPEHLFAKDEYWFYCNDIYINNLKQPDGVDKIDFQNNVMQQNIIVLLATEATLHLFPFGFSEKFYNNILLQKANNYLSYEKKIAYWENRISGDEDWYKVIKEKAVERNVSVKEALRSDAIYMIEISK